MDAGTAAPTTGREHTGAREEEAREREGERETDMDMHTRTGACALTRSVKGLRCLAQHTHTHTRAYVHTHHRIREGGRRGGWCSTSTSLAVFQEDVARFQSSVRKLDGEAVAQVVVVVVRRVRGGREGEGGSTGNVVAARTTRSSVTRSRGCASRSQGW